ncbi:MAG: hypothetical protein ABMB14_32490, partial [Myxococcota bacterium]
MSSSSPMTVTDLERMIDAEAPDLVNAILAFARQDEPYRPDAPPDALDLSGLRSGLTQARSARRKAQRRERSRAVWARYLAQDPAQLAPQMQLAGLIERLYATRTGPARQVLLTLIREAPLLFGLWGGFKRVYKRAEADLDAEVYAALATRVDEDLARSVRGDVGAGTLRYLSRRTWRFVRQLGKASPELYVTFAVELMRSVGPSSDPRYLGATGHVAHHYARKWGANPEATRGKRFQAPYLEAWKRSADPLMLLLETCRSDGAAAFAIDGLRELFPEVLRDASAEWLARLCHRPLAAAHDFVVETLEGPKWHSANLRSLGLHDAVLALLASPSPRARTYAVTYARSHAGGLTVEFLVKLVDPQKYGSEVVKFAASLLTAKPARELGLPVVIRLLRFPVSTDWARKVLKTEFETREFDHELLASLVMHPDTSDFGREFVTERFGKTGLPSSFWIGILHRPDLDDAEWDTADHVLERLAEYPVASLPAAFLLEALGNDDWSYTVTDWLESAEALPPDLDAERVKGLVFDPETRDVAFTLLQNTKLFTVAQIGTPFLLALARRADPSLHQWAHEYLLQNVGPGAFADGGDVRAGAARLFSLATAAKEPDAMRAFAQTYLLCHHPKVGPQQERSRSLGIDPQLPRDVYSAALVWPTLWDDRPDVRRFGVAVARAELVRWNEPHRVYELADAPSKEVRNVAYDALTQAGERHADPDLALTLDQLDPALVFSMTESTIGATRDVAMTLIRKHYARLGGAERLGWLMQSADREVRMYAVRL